MTFFQQSFELSHTYFNDWALKSTLKRCLPPGVLEVFEPQLLHVGALSVELYTIASAHRKSEPVHIPFDAFGQRVDRIINTGSWQHFAEVAPSLGLIATAYERTYREFSRVCQFALVYLFDKSSQFYTCPLAMTDGCARTLEIHNDAILNQRIFSRLISRDPKKAFTSGQWMTETTGGSDVGASTTTAQFEDNIWRLYGTKWFTSAVTSDVALTLARPLNNPEGGKGLALFLIELRDEKNRLQNITVRRLKEKLGTTHVPTAELELEGTPALPLFGLDNGIRNMAPMLNITRTWNAIGSIASMQRGLILAEDYAQKRYAFGNLLAHKPLHQKTLGEWRATHCAALQLVFYVISLMGQEELQLLTTEKIAELRLLQILSKLWTAKLAVACASEVLEAFGGQGYIEDTGLPELLRDAQVLPIWEGTTNVLALEALRALQRDNSWRFIEQTLREKLKKITHETLKNSVNIAVKKLEHLTTFCQTFDHNKKELNARIFAMTLAQVFALTLLLEHTEWAKEPQWLAAAQTFTRICERENCLFYET